MYIYEIMDYSTDIAFVSGISDLYMYEIVSEQQKRR